MKSPGDRPAIAPAYRPDMSERIAEVVALNISVGGIPKQPIEVAEIAHAGIVGDGHDHEKHNTPLQAISLLDLEDLDDLKREGFDVGPGATGENITLRGADIDQCEIGDRFLFSGGVELELTKRRKPCYVLDAIDPELKNAAPGRIGFLAKVIRPGVLRAGETVRIASRAMVDA